MANVRYTDIIDWLNDDENLLLHGPGGTGKTQMLKHIVRTFCRSEYESVDGKIETGHKDIAVVTPTGLAAVNLSEVNAMTINKYFSIPAIESMTIEEIEAKADELAAKARRYNNTYNLINLDMLIIDEISMVGRTLFTLVDLLLQNICCNHKPMGGKQVILSGDFYQLSPVKDDWCFLSSTWKNLKLRYIPFVVPYRYNGSNKFNMSSDDVYAFMQRCRKGEINDVDKSILDAMGKAYEDKEYMKFKIKPVLLMPRRKQVKSINDNRLRALKTPLKRYKAVDTVAYLKTETKYLQMQAKSMLDSLCSSVVEYKQGAKIMINKNIDQENGLVNGTMGVIVEANDSSIIMELLNGRHVTLTPVNYRIDTKSFTVTRSQLPFELAWAITVHKSQGISLESSIISLDGIFDDGQAYVAISRNRNLDNLFISGKIDTSVICSNKQLPPEVIE